MTSPGGFRSRVRLGPGREFDLIRTLIGTADELPPEVRVGPGDDCAVVEGSPLALTCDLAVEDVHFRRSWLEAGELGGRTAAAALSDLAAVAAEPLGVLVAYAAPPKDVDDGFMEAVHGGLARTVAAAGAAVLGGDVSRSPGPLILNVMAVGRVDEPVLRDGARPGDEVWVTGRLGAAGAAVRALQAGADPEPEARGAWARPAARLAEARWLVARAAIHALVDLSDGLGADAGHIAAASGVGIVLAAERIPVAPVARSEGPGEREALVLALSAGEDYELCLAAAPGMLSDAAGPFRERFGLPLTRVGRVVEGHGVYLDRGDGEPVPLQGSGYDHFRHGREGT